MVNATLAYEIAAYAGSTSLVGYLSELDLPTIENTTVDFEALGLQGSIRMSTGKEPMECRMGWQGHGVQISTIGYNLEEVQEIMFRTYIEKQGAVAKILTPVVFVVRGIVRSKEGGNFAAKSAMTHETVMDCTYYSEEIDGIQTIEYDPANNVYNLNGRNLWAQRNAILGLS